MKKLGILLLAMIMMISSALTLSAEDGTVTYKGSTKEFIFEPGSEYSVTDLFPNFKDVMPGDTLTQKITVRNDMAHYFVIKVYLRALGAQDGSEEFLSQLKLTVKKSDGQGETNLFEAPANETAGLTDWVSLGEFYAGAEVDLDLILEVPVTLGNEFKNQIGYLDWEFWVEEFPTGNGWQPPQPTATAVPTEGAAKTGDNANLVLWYSLLGVSGVGLVILFLWKRKENQEE